MLTEALVVTDPGASFKYQEITVDDAIRDIVRIRVVASVAERALQIEFQTGRLVGRQQR